MTKELKKEVEGIKNGTGLKALCCKEMRMPRGYYFTRRIKDMTMSGVQEIYGLIIMGIYVLVGVGLVFVALTNKARQYRTGSYVTNKTLSFQIIFSGILVLIMSISQFYTCYTLINEAKMRQQDTLLVMHYRDASDIPIFFIVGIVACILGIFILMRKYLAYVMAIILLYIYIPYGIIKNTVTIVDIVSLIFMFFVLIQWKKEKIT